MSVEGSIEVWKAEKPELCFPILMYSISEFADGFHLDMVCPRVKLPQCLVPAVHSGQQCLVMDNYLWHPDLGGFVAECLQPASPGHPASPELHGNQQSPVASTPLVTEFIQFYSRISSETSLMSSLPLHI